MELLKQAMEAEKERAQWEKHERRMLKLRKGGHDISSYHAKFEGMSLKIQLVFGTILNNKNFV